MAPNLDPRASRGSFFQARSPGRLQIQPSCQKWAEIFRDLGLDFLEFSDFPQMENRDLGWLALGLGSPKTIFSAKKQGFWAIFGHFGPTRTVPSASNIPIDYYLYSAVRGPSGGPAQGTRAAVKPCSFAGPEVPSSGRERFKESASFQRALSL